MGLYHQLRADEQAIIDKQVQKMLADPTRIPPVLRQKFGDNEAGLRTALQEGYADPVKIALLRQQQKNEALGSALPR